MSATTPATTYSSATLRPSAHADPFAREQLPPPERWPVFRLEAPYLYPDRLNAAAELLDRAVAEGDGGRVAIVSPDGAGGWTDTTYAALQRMVDGIAHRLADDMRLVPGNRVLLRGFNGPWMAAAWLATLKAGCIAVATMPMLRAKELGIVMSRARCDAALCDAALLEELHAALPAAPSVREVRTWGGDAPDRLDLALEGPHRPFAAVETSSDDVALIAFTSGTTGVPKGCMHFHRDVMAMCDGFSKQVLRPHRDDRFIGTPPLAFTFGLGALLCFPMAARAATVLLPKAAPDTLLQAIGETRATISATAPTFYRNMALCLQQHPGRFDTSSLRQSVSAGEALPDATRTLWRRATGVEMLDGIGATEMIHIFIAAANDQVRPGAIGRAVPGYEVAVLGEELRPLPAGEVGRLAVRGPTGCRYMDDPRQATYVQGGWNLTGDACWMDTDGYVFFKARTDDLIISSGYNIGAPEVESAVLTHPAAAECAVVGVPDEERGQLVKAFVVLKPDALASDALAREIQEHVKRTIAPYKYPRQVEFVPALPKTDTGKLQRFRLRDGAPS